MRGKTKCLCSAMSGDGTGLVQALKLARSFGRLEGERRRSTSILQTPLTDKPNLCQPQPGAGVPGQPRQACRRRFHNFPQPQLCPRQRVHPEFESWLPGGVWQDAVAPPLASPSHEQEEELRPGGGGGLHGILYQPIRPAGMVVGSLASMFVIIFSTVRPTNP